MAGKPYLSWIVFKLPCCIFSLSRSLPQADHNLLWVDAKDLSMETQENPASYGSVSSFSTLCVADRFPCGFWVDFKAQEPIFALEKPDYSGPYRIKLASSFGKGQVISEINEAAPWNTWTFSNSNYFSLPKKDTTHFSSSQWFSIGGIWKYGGGETSWLTHDSVRVIWAFSD